MLVFSFLLPLNVKIKIMLSNACQYAIRSVLYLALYGGENNKLGAKAIAEELEVPPPFLAKLLQKLSRNNLISSLKGPKGGFYLNETDKKNTVLNIIECIDGTDTFSACFLGLKQCSDTNPCPVHFTVAPFKKKLMRDFNEKNIAQFAEEIKEQENITIKNIDLLS